MAVHADIMKEDTGIDKDGGGKLSYAEAVKDREKIETKIGLSLAKDSRVTKIAANIHEKSLITLNDEDKSVITTQANKFGGARASQEDIETLGRYVFETMHHIEKDKAAYSESKTADHPYFPTGQKKPEFDKPISTLSFVDLPTTAQTYLTEKATAPLPPNASGLSFNYDGLDPNAKFAILKDYRYQNEAAQATATLLKEEFSGKEAIKAVLEAIDNASPEERENKRTDAITTIRAAISTTTNDDEKAQLGALLDVVVDKHTSGDNTNMVKRGNNPDNPKEDQWIEDTVKAGKPIISGPSGHTLRYLNFWAEKRKQEKERAGGNINGWPSLEAARLVMMANLMPPKHHSYDEIMTSSIGIKDETKPPLLYKHKSSYLDLATHQETDAKEIALNAYAESEAKEVVTDSTTDQTPEGYNSDSEKDLIDQAIETLNQIKKQIPSLTTKLGSVQVALRAEKGKV